VDRQLDELGNLENRYVAGDGMGDGSSFDDSWASQHFHIDVDGSGIESPRMGLRSGYDLRQRKIIYYPRERFPDPPREKDVTGFVGRTNVGQKFIQPYGLFWTLWSVVIVLSCMYQLLMVPIILGWPFLGNPGM